MSMEIEMLTGVFALAIFLIFIAALYVLDVFKD